MTYESLIPALLEGFHWTEDSTDLVSNALRRTVATHPKLFAKIESIEKEDIHNVPLEIVDVAFGVSEAILHLDCLLRDDVKRAIARDLGAGNLALDGSDSAYQKLLKFEADFWLLLLTRLADGHFRAEQEEVDGDFEAFAAEHGGFP